MLDDFHFIRPWILIGIPLALLVWWLARRAADPARPWRKAMDRELLEALLVREGSRRRLRPHDLLLALCVVGAMAAAGPTWRREPSPFQEESASVMIVLECSPSMDQRDLSPSRLERGKLEISDFLEARPGAKHGLVAYGGSAHLVMPPTSDPEVIRSMAGELGSDLMPSPGEDLGAAIELAVRALGGKPGGILLVADDPAGPPVFSGEVPRVDVAWIPTLPAGGVPEAVKSAARTLGAEVVEMTIDDQDSRRAARALSKARATGAGDAAGFVPRWEEAGYWLCPLVLLLCLPFFRRGWFVRWAVVVLAVAPVIGGDRAMAEGEPARSQSTALTRLFLTPDQHGQRLFDAGRYEAAALTFLDPMRRGVAWFRAGDFERAAAAFAAAGGPEAGFNRGNALVMMGKYQDAVAAYDEALEARPDWTEAGENREIARLRAEALDFTGGDMTGGKLEADEIVFDQGKKPDSEGGEQEEVAGEGMSDKEIEALWLRRVQTKPRDFLRAKFALQAAKGEGQ